MHPFQLAEDDCATRLHDTSVVVCLHCGSYLTSHCQVNTEYDRLVEWICSICNGVNPPFHGDSSLPISYLHAMYPQMQCSEYEIVGGSADVQTVAFSKGTRKTTTLVAIDERLLVNEWQSCEDSVEGIRCALHSIADNIKQSSRDVIDNEYLSIVLMHMDSLSICRINDRLSRRVGGSGKKFDISDYVLGVDVLPGSVDCAEALAEECNRGYYQLPIAIASELIDELANALAAQCSRLRREDNTCASLSALTGIAKLLSKNERVDCAVHLILLTTHVPPLPNSNGNGLQSSVSRAEDVIIPSAARDAYARVGMQLLHHGVWIDSFHFGSGGYAAEAMVSLVTPSSGRHVHFTSACDPAVAHALGQCVRWSRGRALQKTSSVAVVTARANSAVTVNIINGAANDLTSSSAAAASIELLKEMLPTGSSLVKQKTGTGSSSMMMIENDHKKKMLSRRSQVDAVDAATATSTSTSASCTSCWLGRLRPTTLLSLQLQQQMPMAMSSLSSSSSSSQVIVQVVVDYKDYSGQRRTAVFSSALDRQDENNAVVSTNDNSLVTPFEMGLDMDEWLFLQTKYMVSMLNHQLSQSLSALEMANEYTSGQLLICQV